MSSRAIRHHRHQGNGEGHADSRSRLWASRGLGHVSPLLQRKVLTIGAPNDRYEREADRVAGEVMRMPVSYNALSRTDERISRKCATCSPGKEACPECKEEEDEQVQRKPQISKVSGSLRRQAEEGELEEEEELGGEQELLQAKAASGGARTVSPDVGAQIGALRGGGRPLPESTRTFFEARFGHDFSKVRVHADSRAAEAARSVNARAFTVGPDVVFAPGQYAPRADSGKRLLAHELTHVVQQAPEAVRPLVSREPSAVVLVSARHRTPTAGAFIQRAVRGGMFVRAAEPHAVGTLLKFELELSRSSTAVVGLGEVVWIRLEQRDQQRSPGMGIQFRYLDVESLSLLDAAVRKALVDRSVPERPVGPSPDESERSKRLLCEFEEVLARKQLDSTRAPGKQG